MLLFNWNLLSRLVKSLQEIRKKYGEAHDGKERYDNIETDFQLLTQIHFNSTRHVSPRDNNLPKNTVLRNLYFKSPVARVLLTRFQRGWCQ